MAKKSNPSVNVETAEHDTTPKVMSPAKVAAIARAEATGLVNKQVGGFTNFLREQSVVGIGIGLVLGIQVKAVVDTFMASLVNPMTQLILPGQEALNKRTVEVAIGEKTAAIGWGAIAYSLFTFILVAVLVYAGYKILKLDKLAKKKDK